MVGRGALPAIGDGPTIVPDDVCGRGRPRDELVLHRSGAGAVCPSVAARGRIP